MSGAGIVGHESFVTGIPGSRLALSEAGFMRVDRLKDGRVRLGVIVVKRGGQYGEVHAEWLNGSKGEAAGGATSIPPGLDCPLWGTHRNNGESPEQGTITCKLSAVTVRPSASARRTV